MCPVNARHPIFMIYFIITNRCKLSSSRRALSLKQQGQFTDIKINISIHRYGKRRQKVAEKQVVEGSRKRILQAEAFPGER
jgi:hypothetical protein